MNIVTQANEFFIPGLRAMLYSLGKNNEDEYFDIYFLDTEFSHYDSLTPLFEHFKFKRHDIKLPQEYSDFLVDTIKNPATIQIYSVLSSYRLFFPWLLPIERALYLDADMIVNKNIKAIYESDLQDSLIGACVDVAQDNPEYFNAGLILFDLEKIRKEISVNSVKQLCIKYSNNLAFDQDILNELFLGKTELLDWRFNTHIPTDAFFFYHYYFDFTDAYIYHMTGTKIWGNGWSNWDSQNSHFKSALWHLYYAFMVKDQLI